jgi:hypothetical protein
MKCWAAYDWSKPDAIIETLDQTQMDALLGYFATIKDEGVKPALRIPMTASYWMNV